MIPTQFNPTPEGEFLANFGIPPGSQDARADCVNWERLCAKLLEERSRLQAELECSKAIHAFISEGFKFDMTREEVFAQVDRQTSLDQLIAELEQEARES
jgi:hypothetical protein